MEELIIAAFNNANSKIEEITKAKFEEKININESKLKEFFEKSKEAEKDFFSILKKLKL